MTLKKLDSDENFGFLRDENNEIYSYGESLAFITNSIEIPSWSLSKKFSNIHNQHLEPFLKEILSIKEINRRFQFFLLIDEIELIDYDFLKDRYNGYLDQIILPNSLSGYESIDRELLGYEKYNNELRLFHWSLKDEYRTF
jgi:hypothetical protein